MKKQILFTVLVASLLFCGCRGRDAITFKGEIPGGDGRYLTISRVGADGLTVLDSAEIQKGRFNIAIHPDDAQPAFYQLSLSDADGFTTIARRGERLTLQAEAGKLVQTYHIEGGTDAALMEQLDRQLALFIDSTDVLMQKYESSGDEELHAQIEAKYLEIKENHRNFLMSFIRRNSHSLAVMPAFFQRHCQAVFFTLPEDSSILKEMADTLAKDYPDNKDVKWIYERLQKR